MGSKKNIEERLLEYADAKNQAHETNCITEDLSNRAKHVLNKFSSTQIKGPLFGKLFSIKDNINIKGYSTTCASNILKNHKSIYTATAVSRIEKAGGLVVAKTNLDEFGMGSSNEHSIFGPSKNPANKDFVCGGSSGGSAASVASGIVDISLGSDTGGSVRQPASFCGVYGLKPTYGRVSRYGLTAFASSFDQIGVLSRDLDDLIFTFESISGYDVKDNTTSKNKLNIFNFSSSKTKKMVVGIPKEYMTESIDVDVKSKMSKMIKFLKQNDFIVKDITLPLTNKCIGVYYILTTAEASSNLSRYDGVVYGKRNDSRDIIEMYKTTRTKYFGDEVKRRIILGTFILSSGYYDSYYNKALKVRRLIKNDFTSAFKTVDILLTPTSPFPAFRIGEKINDPIRMYLSDIFTVPMSLAGLPAMNVPVGLSTSDLPIGLQLTANQFDENKIFSLAKFIGDNFEK